MYYSEINFERRKITYYLHNDQVVFPKEKFGKIE